VEAHDIEIEALFFQRLQFDAQHLLVPPGAQRQPVVGQHQSAPLRFGQVVENDDRDFPQPEFPGGKQARVARDDHAVPPTKIGFVQPNSVMLAATCATCSSECVRALRA